MAGGRHWQDGHRASAPPSPSPSPSPSLSSPGGMADDDLIMCYSVNSRKTLLRHFQDLPHRVLENIGGAECAQDRLQLMLLQELWQKARE
eukprot:1141468-Pelagomonas_calceolata.AAC.4